MADALKPCPFDGLTCNPELLKVQTIAKLKKTIGFVECQDCGARGPRNFADNKTGAIDTAIYGWNDRGKYGA